MWDPVGNLINRGLEFLPVSWIVLRHRTVAELPDLGIIRELLVVAQVVESETEERVLEPER